MPLDLNHARTHLANFDFAKLFIEELGWSPPTSRQPIPISAKEAAGTCRQIAQLAGVVVLEVAMPDGRIPDARARTAIHKQVCQVAYENLLIFVDGKRTQSLWYWVKRHNGKLFPRDHIYMRGQPGDLFLSKLNAMVFDLSDFDEAGHVHVTAVTGRLHEALDVERVTKKFFTEFDAERLEFTELITGIPDERDHRWYASVLLNRLMFIYFLQRKFFLNNGDDRYLQNKLAELQQQGRDRYYAEFLKALFFEGFAKPVEQRSPAANKLLGNIKYLNGGLFLEHPIEERHRKIAVPDKAFANLFALFERYSWNLNDTPGGADNEINPDVLGYIFEKYINQKAFGAYYTRPEITEYLCERTIHRLVLDAVNADSQKPFADIGDLLLNLDAPLCKKLLHQVLPDLRLLDPACGSAAFLVAAMKTLINIYSAAIGKIEFLNDRGLEKWIEGVRKKHPSVSYFIKKSIITDNLFGVDIMEEAVEIAKLRLFLALVASARTVDDLEPLPNIEFNIMAGNSLIGLLQVDAKDFDRFAHDLASAAIFKDYRQVLQEKNELVGLYRRATSYATDLQSLRDGIEKKKQTATATLNHLLLDQFQSLGIKFEQATWDDKEGDTGKPVKRALKLSDIEALQPFHWGFEFDEIINQRCGFDAIITNPPWEIFKPNSKEFFEEFSDLVTKKKMTIHEFEKAQTKLLTDREIRQAWLAYLNEYPHVSAFYRAAPQYRNQISIVDGKKAGSDINLYKLFLEQCLNLLRKGGRCGIIVPSGVYTDLGTKQLREVLFSKAAIDSLFGLSNERFIFETVHHAFKFCLLTFEKGDKTKVFRAAFCINPREAIAPAEIEQFLHSPEAHLGLEVELIRRLSPDSLSVMEFKTPLDVQIATKISDCPKLGDSIAGKWNLVLGNEFHMTGDSHLFKTNPGNGRLPLYEGKMIWQFDHRLAQPRYWVDEHEGRETILGREPDKGQSLGYQHYRLGHRSVAASTNERTMIATILPRDVFFGHSINATRKTMGSEDLLYLSALLNSVVVDCALRSSVSQNLTMFFIYQLPVPRLTVKDAAFGPVVRRAARLICTTAEFDALAKEVGLKSHRDGATEPTERAKLRAELDGLIAHLYGLTEEEFAHILTTFPLVPDPVKTAAHNAYRDVERGLIK